MPEGFYIYCNYYKIIAFYLSVLVPELLDSCCLLQLIKREKPKDLKEVDNYKESLRNLARAGLDLLSYSFMPLFDWLRTDTDYHWHDGSRALSFSMDSFRVFDIYILKRPGATTDYSLQEVKRAAKHFSNMSKEEVDTLSRTIVSGLHGQKGYSIDSFRSELARWKGVTNEKLCSNLKYFAGQLLEVAEQENILFSLHPDDPSMSLMELPNVASTYCKRF